MSAPTRHASSVLLAVPLLLCLLLPGPGRWAQAAEPYQHSAQAGGRGAEPVQPAESEDEQAQFKHSPAVQLVARLTRLSLEHAYWLCVLLNFAVIAGAIFWLSKKNLPGAFSNRSAAIQQAIEEARQANAEANQRLAEIEARLSRLGSEIAGLRATAEKEAAVEEARIKAAAEQDARKIVASAEQEIAAAAKSARRELTAYAANLAVSLAGKQIKVDTATDQALVREFAKALSPKIPPGGGSGKDGH